DHLLLDPVRKGTCAPPRAIYYSTRLERALVPLRVPFITRPVWKGHLCPSACHLLLDPFGKGTCAPPRAADSPHSKRMPRLGVTASASSRHRAATAPCLLGDS